MAQPIYDDLGPLDEYLRLSGDMELMPGTLPEFTLEHEYDEENTLKDTWVHSMIFGIVRIVDKHFTSHAPHSPQHEFAERFKYVVISSSLLSTSLSQQFHPSHSRSSSATTNWVPHDTPASHRDASRNTIRNKHTRRLHWPPALIFFSSFLIIVSLSAGRYATVLVIIAATKLYASTLFPNQSSRSPQTVLSLDTLDTLVEADAAWNAVVGEAMVLLEKEGGHSPISPAAPIRVSLNSCLQTTATQCDNIRQLFSPLAAPAELSQLSEMYAPSSPALSAHSVLNNPLHTATTSGLRSARSTSILDKRSTWSGFPRPREGLGIRTASHQSANTLSGEDSFSSSLLHTGKAYPVSETADTSLLSDDGELPFGVMALQLQRSYRTPQRQSLEVPKKQSASVRTSPISASRFTTLQKSRHPFSYTALQNSLQAALSSKRFACCNLLALRFEDEDDAYWEDVHSVISLLITTLQDETARLSEALESSHLVHQREQLPTAPATPINPSLPLSQKPRRRHRPQDSISFAPLPSHLAKFISHAEAIGSALDQAGDALHACTSSVRKLAGVPLDADEQLASAATAALEAYEALRHDLGIALRDCERARDPLLGLIPKANDVESDLDEPAVPPLAQDHSSAADSDSGQGDPALDSPHTSAEYVSRGSGLVDDVTRHLLVETSAAHLPPPGEEQLFEAESAPSGRRERSSLTRAERIALTKSKRECVSLPPVNTGSRPGGEIVEELKQVISRVNDRKKHRLSLLRTPVAIEDDPSALDASSDVFHSSTDSLLTTIPSYINTHQH